MASLSFWILPMMITTLKQALENFGYQSFWIYIFTLPLTQVSSRDFEEHYGIFYHSPQAQFYNVSASSNVNFSFQIALWKYGVTSRELIARTSLKSQSHQRIGSRTCALWRNSRVTAMENAHTRAQCAWTSTIATLKEYACASLCDVMTSTAHSFHRLTLWLVFSKGN